MWEMLSNAWSGWSNYVYHGKYAALLILVLVLYWFFNDNKKEPVLMGYTTIMTAGCICPLTAGLLMQYQTRFYDYQWIWNYVPLIIVVAYGGVLFLEKCRNVYQAQSGAGICERAVKGKTAVTFLAVVILVLFCGKLGYPVFDAGEERLQQEEADEVLAMLAREEDKILLWAPQEIMASARREQPQIELIYGRNMWDAALGAYTYETYGEAETNLYYWMRYAEDFGTIDGYAVDGTLLKGEVCMQNAAALGVNSILLPGLLSEESVKALAEALELWPERSDNMSEQEPEESSADVEMSKLGDYYLITL